jgi:hypothetical protein
MAGDDRAGVSDFQRKCLIYKIPAAILVARSVLSNRRPDNENQPDRGTKSNQGSEQWHFLLREGR